MNEANQPFQNCEEIPLGEEFLVHIHNRALNEDHDPDAIPDLLDHDVDDQTTYRFFELQGQPDKEFFRSFYDDVYGLRDGVKLGFGETIASEHLGRGDDRYVIVQHPKPVKIPFSLYFNSNRLITRLHQSVIDTLVQSVPDYLG